MKRRHVLGAIRRGLAAAAFALAVGAAPAVADTSAEQAFRGKTIRLVVDFKPGGGTDVQARYFAANLGKFIAGNPKLTVTNLFPNPAGRNYVWKSAPDGLTLSFLATSGIGTEFVEPNAHFESDKFTQIGSHAKRDVVLLVRGNLPYNSLLDAKGGKQPIIIAEPVGSIEDISGKVLGIGALALWLDIPLRVATVARSGSADALVMLERGDVNGYIAGSHWYSLPTLRPGWFAKGYLKPLADMGHPDAPVLPNSEISMTVPNVMTWLSDEQKELWKGIYLSEVLSGKGMAGPPGMPANITKALRDGYANALTDPEFAKGLEKLQGQPIALIRGERMQQLVAETTQAFKAALPKYQELRQQVYNRLAR